ncbi:MAG: STT3 domain-containing protein [Thermoproteota archaeon]
MMRAREIVRKTSGLMPSISTQSYVKTSIFITLILLSIAVRLHNFPLGFYLGEFDPYWHYRSAEYIMENGLSAFLEWVDYMSWYPYGRAAAASTPPGLPLAAVGLHAFLNALGVTLSLMDVAILFPPFISVLAVIIMFFMGRELSGDDWVGLLAMLFLAFNGSFIDRSHLGFFKHECLGIPLIAISAYLFVKSVKSENVSKLLLYSILSGLVLGYLCISWTAYVYMVGLVALFSILVALFTGRETTDRTLIAYAVTMGISILIAIQFPRPGEGAIYSVYYIAVIVGFVAVLLMRYLKRVEASLTIPILIGFTALALSATILLFNTGLFSSLMGKMLAVVNPSARFEQPIVESVAEHKMSTWYSLFTDHGLLLLLFAIGTVSSIFQGDKVSKIFIISAGLSSLYFANMMVRIGLVFSPFVSFIAAVGCSSLINYSYPAISERIKIGRRVAAPRKTGIWGLVLSAVLILYAGYHGINTGISMHVQGEGGASLPTSSIPAAYSFPDWIEALTWIRYNTPPGSVVLSWWDYGYWITTLGERPTLIDNATINSTQVAVVGRIFMSNDTVAIPLLKKYNISYITVFSMLPWHWYIGRSIGLWGDEGKWTWMAAIGYNLMPVNSSYNWISNDYREGGYADLNLTRDMQDTTMYSYSGQEIKYLPSGGVVLPRGDSVLARLIVNTYMEHLKGLGVSPPERFQLSTSPFYELVFVSPTWGFVSVYKVNYNASYGEENMVLGSSTGTALRNSSKLYVLPLIPDTNMVIDVKDMRMEEGEAQVDNASRVLKANVSLVVKVNGNVERLYPVSLGEYRLIYDAGSLQITVNQTLIETVPLPEDASSVEAGFLMFAEGVETGSVTSPAYAYVSYEVRIEIP